MFKYIINFSFLIIIQQHFHWDFFRRFPSYLTHLHQVTIGRLYTKYMVPFGKSHSLPKK